MKVMIKVKVQTAGTGTATATKDPKRGWEAAQSPCRSSAEIISVVLLPMQRAAGGDLNAENNSIRAKTMNTARDDAARDKRNGFRSVVSRTCPRPSGNSEAFLSCFSYVV